MYTELLTLSFIGFSHLTTYECSVGCWSPLPRHIQSEPFLPVCHPPFCLLLIYPFISCRSAYEYEDAHTDTPTHRHRHTDTSTNIQTCRPTVTCARQEGCHCTLTDYKARLSAGLQETGEGIRGDAGLGQLSASMLPLMTFLTPARGGVGYGKLGEK